ncbi:unnamed protein product [Pieris macdunnoughi]|uniref:RNA-directed DNA polymerase n=1 Tax=Pieris macdunnoughi TaxID=345717 RepID=A0A821XS44_9NEOP|nr:unnamed protein product [Pieris macdunnoughi]
MDEVVRGFNFCYPYIDDVLVFSKTPEEHAEHLRSLFRRFAKYGIVVNTSKCILGTEEVFTPDETVSSIPSESDYTQDSMSTVANDSLTTHDHPGQIKKRMNPVDIEILKILQSSNEVHKSNSPETKRLMPSDEDEAFLVSILPSIKRLPEDDKMEFWIHVIQLIRKYTNRLRMARHSTPTDTGTTLIVKDENLRKILVTQGENKNIKFDAQASYIVSHILGTHYVKLEKIIRALENGHGDENAHYWSGKGYLMNDGLLYRHKSESDSDEAQLVVPEHEWANMLVVYHDDPNAGHYGADKTYQAISRRYYWIGMRKYIESYAKQCIKCQRYKPSNQKPAELLQTHALSQRFEVISFDLFGPLPPSSDGKTWIFIVEDINSRWVELFSLEDATAERCATVLIN